MALFQITVNITEYGRTLLIEADSKRQAREKALSGEWPEEGSGDPTHYKTQVVGKAIEMIRVKK